MISETGCMGVKCLHGGTCLSVAVDGYKCQCVHGYVGRICQRSVHLVSTISGEVEGERSTAVAPGTMDGNGIVRTTPTLISFGKSVPVGYEVTIIVCVCIFSLT